MFLDHRRRVVLAVLSLCLAPAAALAQPNAEVSGTVVDARTGVPVAGAAVSAGGRRTGTDDDGGFRLCGLPAGETTVRAEAHRHHPAAASVILAPGGGAAVTLGLEPDTARPTSIILDRRPYAPRPSPPPMYILDGERVFFMMTGCETPVPGIRVIEEIPADDITEIQVFRDDEAVARYGPEARRGVVIITTRRPRTP